MTKSPGRFNIRNNFCSLSNEYARVDKISGKAQDDLENPVRCEKCRDLNEDPTKRACAEEETEKHLTKMHEELKFCVHAEPLMEN